MTQQHYESWRISYQSSEAAARSAWQEMIRLHHRVNELEAQLSAIGAGGVEPLRKPPATASCDTMNAVLSCPHTITHESITLHFAPGKEGHNALSQLRQRLAAATAHPAEGVPEQAGTYAEARECEHCNHVGINDAANGIASCTACKWNGDSPKEDKCPDCEAEGTMTASCPKCHHEYRLIADATLADHHPTQQGLEQAIEWPKARDVGRFGDMSPDAFIRVGLDADNDVYVSICDGTSVADIEFCTPGGGGGRSSRTRMALIALMCAIEADNASHPAFDFWQRNLAAQAKQGEQ